MTNTDVIINDQYTFETYNLTKGSKERKFLCNPMVDEILYFAFKNDEKALINQLRMNKQNLFKDTWEFAISAGISINGFRVAFKEELDSGILTLFAPFEKDQEESENTQKKKLDRVYNEIKDKIVKETIMNVFERGFDIIGDSLSDCCDFISDELLESSDEAYDETDGFRNELTKRIYRDVEKRSDEIFHQIGELDIYQYKNK